MLPGNNELFELSTGGGVVRAKLITIGECRNLDEVNQRISKMGCLPLESEWCEILREKFMDKQEKGYKMIGFVGKPEGCDRIFPYICIEGGCSWRVGFSHCNWAMGTFLDCWLFAVTEI